MKRSYDKGTEIFREGDAADFVIKLLSGRVEVFRRIGGEEISLGTVGPGEFLGEMGIIEGRNRVAGARAVEPVEAEVMTPKAFLALVSSDADAAHELILRLSARLRAVEDRLIGNLSQAVSGDGVGFDLTLSAKTNALKWFIGTAPIKVTSLPFVVGRHVDPADSVPEGVAADLVIEDPLPYRLAPRHFGIFLDGEALVARDFSTPLGTIVNGTPLGGDFLRVAAPLRLGENEIVAGGKGSPYTFELTVAKSAA